MTDILLILITLVLLVLTWIMRTLLGVRIPAEIRLKPTKLKQAPDIMADLFTLTDQHLSDLGFSHGYWANVHTMPPLPGVSAPLVRLYHHKNKPIIARVSPPHSIYSTDRCQVTFISISKKKTFLVTRNRVPELFPRPPEDRAILLNTRVDSVAEQFSAHILQMSRLGLTWLDRSGDRGEATWLFRLANRFEAKRIQWLIEGQYVKHLADGSSVPRIGILLDFIRRLVTGQERNPPRERSAIPSYRAAYLFQNWQQSNRLSLPISTQLVFFLVSTLAFVLVAGLLWDWTMALLLLVVIGLHEAGHWLTMRLLGYRNLQIQMLPLVGGITLGQGTCYNALHRILVSLMGPLPGIIFGLIVLLFNGLEGGWISKLGLTLVVVNYLNLLPIMPLDGGQILKALVPTRRYGVLITLEWLGSAALLLLGWLSDSLFIGVMALLPFFSGLALMKRKKVIDSLEDVTEDVEEPSLNKRIVSVIQAIDNNDKNYRPLKKKAKEIAETLTTVALKPLTHNVAMIFLSIYLATFLLPPVVVYTTSPGIEGITMQLFSDNEDIRQAANDRIMELPMSQVVMELAERHRIVSDPDPHQGSKVIIRQPATTKSITSAEMRLGIQIDEEYLQFLETSNGFISQLSSTNGQNFLIYPIEEVVRFGQKLPEIVSRLNSEIRSNASQHVRILEATETIEAESERLAINQLAHMLVIGNPHEGNYLLVDSVSQPAESAMLYEVYESPGGLEGRRFKSLRHYLTYHHSMLQVASLDQ